MDFSIGHLTNIPVFSPDQVAEALLGFDSAWMIPANMFSHFGPMLYVRRSRARRREMGVKINKSLLARLPPYGQLPSERVKFNLFLQYKIPEFLQGYKSAQWRHWSRSYFRVTLTEHQQVVLSKIDDVANERAVAVYCMPAFVSKDSLHDWAETGMLIANSHFVRSGFLTKHHAYTYIDARGMGQAHSETSGVPSTNIEALLGEPYGTDEPMPLQVASGLALQGIERAIEGSRLSAVYRRSVSRFLEPDSDTQNLFVRLVKIYLFEQVFGIRVMFVMSDSE